MSIINVSALSAMFYFFEYDEKFHSELIIAYII